MKRIIVLCAMLLVLPCMAYSNLIPDTGQEQCAGDSDNLIPCPNPGEDYYGQDAQYNINARSYTKLDANGDDLPDDAPWPWAMVRDNVTELVWEMKTEDDYYTEADAKNVFIPELNSEQFGGFNDWRIPSNREFYSILSFDSTRTTFFPYTSMDFWTSNQVKYVASHIWIAYFSSQRVISKPNPSSGYPMSAVMAVRGEQTTNNFVDHGNGTITDTDTGFMWQKDTAPETYNWKDALAYCENLVLAGHNGWRLPNKNELQSIVDYNRSNPAIDPIFQNTTASYWSSTHNDPNKAWYINFFSGEVDTYPWHYSSIHVRAVRTAEPVPITTTTTEITSSITTTICGEDDFCCTEQVFGEDSEQAALLRYFRDHVLNQTPEGKELIKLYYLWSPAIVKAMEEDEEFKEEVKQMIDGVLPMIEREME